jgi:hypothetical protein
MAVKKNAATAAANWVNRMQTAGPAYKAGVDAVTVAPGQLAASRADLWATNVANSKAKFATKVSQVTLSEWKNLAGTKGADRLASGATGALPKMQAFMQVFIPALQNIVDSLPAGGTYEQNLSRLTAYINSVHAQKGNF